MAKRKVRAAPHERRTYSGAALTARMLAVARPDSNRIIGARLGIGFENVRRYFAGISKPPAAFVAAFCEEYGTSADWLLFGKGSPPPRRLSDAGRALDKAARQLKRADAALAQARAVLSSATRAG